MGGAFAALKGDGSVITWGDADYGGDSSSVAEQLRSGVVSFADPFYDNRLFFVDSELSTPLVLVVDTTPPVFTSGSSAAVDSNSGKGQVVYTANATDSAQIAYSLSADAPDSQFLSIDPATGEVRLAVNPDYATKPAYDFTVLATDAAGNASELSVALAINDNREASARVVQEIGAGQSIVTYRPGTALSLPLVYAASGTELDVAELSFNIHYNGERFMPNGGNNGVSQGHLGDLLAGTALEQDAADLDRNPLTDQLVRLSWAEPGERLPGDASSVMVATANFQTGSNAYDPVTGTPIVTAISFSSMASSADYEFVGKPLNLVPENFHLDIDADGRTTALGDGLMVIRQMLGSALAVDRLTQNAASSDAAVDAQAMRDWLDAGIASGKLDVDKDGLTTTTGDGAMVMRYLLGIPLIGNPVIETAIGDSSPYFGMSNAAELLGQNIESLITNL